MEIDLTAHEQWAFQLEDAQLAEQLNRLAKNVSCHDPERRAAVLREAALRLYKKDNAPPRLRPVS